MINAHRLRRFSLCITLLIVLSACNRPAQEPPAGSIGTSVAATLTAQPTLTPLPPTPFPTTTPALAPSQEPSESPTEQPSQTVEPTASSEPTNTPFPLDPDDPRSGLNLSSPDYSDDFSVAGTWFQYPLDFEDATIRWEDGRLRASDNLIDGYIWWSASALQVEDVYAEIEVEIDGCAGRDGYGMAIRVGGDNFDRGYTFEATCDGQYRVRKFISESAPRVLLDWTAAPSIIQGSGAVNRIGVLAVEDELHFFANGSLLNSQPVIEDEYSDGAIGLFASALQTPELTVYFDDFELWYP